MGRQILKYNIIHKSTGLFFEKKEHVQLVDYSGFWQMQKNYYTPTFYPNSMSYSYSDGAIIKSTDSLFFMILNYFLTPNELKRKDVAFNSINHFLQNFDIVDYKTKKSIINKKFLEKLVRFYLKQRMNIYASMVASDDGSHGTNNVLYENLLKVKYGIAYPDRKTTMLNYDNFLMANVPEKPETHHNCIFFQDIETYNICKLMSNRHVNFIDFIPITTILNNIKEQLDSEIFLKD